MAENLDTYHRYYVVVKNVLLVCGIWPSKELGFLYRVLPFVHVAGLLISACAILNFCNTYFSINLGYFLQAFGLALSYLTGAQKLICFLCYRKRVAELHESLSVTFSQDYQNSNSRSIILSPISLFYRFSLVQWVLMFFVTISYGFKPAFSIIIQLAKGVDNINYILPFPAVFPWKIQGNKWLYWTHYAFQIYGGLCLTISSTAVDTAFGYFIFQISGQLRILSDRMTKLMAKEDHWKVIRECANRYKILIRCREHLEIIYGPVALWLTITSSAVLCALMYQAAHLSPKQLAGVAFYTFLKSIQIFSYGLFGSFMMSENDTFREAIYSCNWAGSGEKSFMTNVLTMLICNKSFLLTACSVSSISVEMFVAVMNTAVSYYLMIRTIEEGKS